MLGKGSGFVTVCFDIMRGCQFFDLRYYACEMLDLIVHS